MQRLALALAVGALVAVGLPAPGQFFAIGLGIAAMGTGWVMFKRCTAAGGARLVGAAAVTLGLLGIVLATVRVVITLAAIGHLEQLVS